MPEERWERYREWLGELQHGRVSLEQGFDYPAAGGISEGAKSAVELPVVARQPRS